MSKDLYLSESCLNLITPQQLRKEFKEVSPNFERLLCKLDNVRYFNNFSIKTKAQITIVALMQCIEFCLHNKLEGKFTKIMKDINDKSDTSKVVELFQKLKSLAPQEQSVQLYNECKSVQNHPLVEISNTLTIAIGDVQEYIAGLCNCRIYYLPIDDKSMSSKDRFRVYGGKIENPDLQVIVAAMKINPKGIYSLKLKDECQKQACISELVQYLVPDLAATQPPGYIESAQPMHSQ